MSLLHHEQLLNYTQLKYLNRWSCCCCCVACGSESAQRVFVFVDVVVIVVCPQSKRPSLPVAAQSPSFSSRRDVVYDIRQPAAVDFLTQFRFRATASILAADAMRCDAMLSQLFGVSTLRCCCVIAAICRHRWMVLQGVRFFGNLLPQPTLSTRK